MWLLWNKKEVYNPLFFLAALWPGWMSITFFMYLMFLIPRDKSVFPIPTFDSLQAFFASCSQCTIGNPSWDLNMLLKIVVILSIVWIIYFAYKHISLLIWNLKQFFAFKKSWECDKIKKTNAQVTLMTLPLTLAMTINVLFVLWAIFIPWLWNIVEFLFPAAIIAFTLVWLLALKIFFDYFIRLLIKWDFDFVSNNNLGQMIAVFAFVMVWVWFAAPAAMSNVLVTSTIWLIWSIFFITIGSFLILLKIILGFKSMFKHWIALEWSPSLWIIIPILTLIGITFVRQQHWLHSHFEGHSSLSWMFVFTTTIISLQLFFWYLWYKIMKSNEYFINYIYWDKKSPWSFALICPWVALFVFSFFFLHLGLVQTWVIEQFSIYYAIILLPLLYLQYKTIYVMLKLNRKFF